MDENVIHELFTRSQKLIKWEADIMPAYEVHTHRTSLDDLGLVPSWLAEGSKCRNPSSRLRPLVRLLASDLAWPRSPSLPNSPDRLSIYHGEVTVSHLFKVSSDSWALCGFDGLLSKLLAGQLLHSVHCSSHNSKGLLISFWPPGPLCISCTANSLIKCL